MSAQVIDYSTLTDRELDVEIAKRLGLTFRDWDGLEICEVHDGVAYWVFKSYATDANAALTLLQETGHEVRHDGDMWIVGETVGTMDYEFEQYAASPDFCRAVCEDWLKYQDAKR